MTLVNYKGVKALVLLLVMISTSFHAWQLGIQRKAGLSRRLPITSLKESAVAYSEVDLKGSASEKKGPLAQIDEGVSTASGGAGGVKVRRRTNVGRKHTEESKAKIARANKGKRPWNAGKKHSEETKARIAERTRSAMMARKQAKLDAMGMTLEEYNESRATQLKEKRKAKAKGGLTLEGRKRISESVKKRWEDPEYRKKYTLANRGNRNHSAETKAKISAAIKAKWEDDAYRAKVNTSSHRPSQEVRDRISRTLKAKWQDPEFRSKMLQNSHERNDKWKEKVSGKIKALWKDPEYRNNVQQGIINSSSSRTARGDGDSGSGAAGGTRRRTAATAPCKKKASAAKKTGTGVKKAAAAAASAAAGKASGAAAASKAAKSSTSSLDFRRRLRVFALGEIKRAVYDLSSSSGGSATSGMPRVDSTEKATATVVSASSIKAALGPELWFEEKMLRRRTHTPPQSEAPLMDDGELGAALLAEMSVSDDIGVGAVLPADTATTAVQQVVVQALARKEAVDWATAMKKAAKAGAKTAAGARGRSSSSSSSSNSSSNNNNSSHSREQAQTAGGRSGTSADTALASAGELAHAVAVDERFGVSNSEDYDGEKDYGWSEEDEDDEDDNYAEYDDDDEHGHEQDEDVIEVYDESGTLVGTYTDEEWARMKSGR